MIKFYYFHEHKKKLVIEVCFRDFRSSCLIKDKYFLKTSISSVLNSSNCCCSKKVIQFIKDFIASPKETIIGSSSDSSFLSVSFNSSQINFMISFSSRIASVGISSSKSLKKPFNASTSGVVQGSISFNPSTIRLISSTS